MPVLASWMRMSLALAVLASLPPPSLAQEDFFRGKTLTFSTFTPPGGSYDTYLRLLTRHIGKHIPGNPSAIVMNQPGAGGLMAVNYAGRIAPQDGTFLTLVGVGLFMQEATGLPGLQLSLKDFNWVGNFSTVNNVFAVWSTSKIKSVEDARQMPSLMGSVGAGSIDAQLPAAVNALIGTKFKVVHGYAGSPAVILAMKRGEVDGKVNGWPSFKVEVPAVERQDLRVILQLGLMKDPDLGDVPLLMDLVKGDARKEAMVRFITLSLAPSRPLALPPNVPKERIDLLRRAFDRTMEDPAFLADAGRTGFDIAPMTGEAVQDAVTQMMSTPKDIIAETKSIMEAPVR
jgi:tripartite-type tricarboxylate transporter receptor subunit TctC